MNNRENKAGFPCFPWQGYFGQQGGIAAVFFAPTHAGFELEVLILLVFVPRQDGTGLCDGD